MSENNSKVVLITGCSTGIGHATAIELASKGFKAYATMRDITKSQFNNNEIEILYLDVDSESSIDKAIK